MLKKTLLIILLSVICCLVLVNCLLCVFRESFLPAINHQPFKSVWSEDEKVELLDMFTISQKIAKSVGIDMIATYGTLLGAIRHQGIIPWDDDVDVVININEREKILSMKDVFNRNNIEIFEYSSSMLKLFPLNKSSIPGCKWAWPFIDIFFYEEKGDTVILYEQGSSGCFSKIADLVKKSDVVKKSDFFPLRETSFESIPVKIPFNPEKILEKFYGKTWETVCVSSTYNHREEKWLRGKKTVPCQSIENVADDIFKNAWVINLERNPERWRKTSDRLANIGIKPKRWNAIDNKSPEFRNFYGSLKTGRTPGEVACYMSHMKLWEHLYETGKPYAIIFEDDIIFPESVDLTYIKKVIDDSKGFNVLLLGHCGASASVESNKATSNVGTGQCSHAYVVSRKGLASLLKEHHDFTIPIDKVTEKFCKNNLCYNASHVNNELENTFGNGAILQDESSGSDIPKPWRIMSLKKEYA